MKRIYYIIFESSYAMSWRIRETLHDMDTQAGLLAIIGELEAETKGAPVIIQNWKLLAEKPAIKDAQPDTQKALSELVAAIYFADNSDYYGYICAAMRALSPVCAELIHEDRSAAYQQFNLNAEAAACASSES